MNRNALLRLTVGSKCLKGVTEVSILYPVGIKEKRDFGNITEVSLHKKNEKLQVLYLLHGNEGNYSSWIRNTRLALFAQKYPGLLIVMPTIKEFQSFRVNEPDVSDYYGYISQELPNYIQKIFPVSEVREDTFIAGIFMGGYLSYRIAMLNPEKYGYVGSISSPLDIVQEMDERYAGSNCMYSAKELRSDPFRDIRTIVEDNLKKDIDMPKTFQACGTDDIMYNNNYNMKNFLAQRLPAHTYFEEMGAHDWYLGDLFAEKLLDWLPLRKKEV